MIRIKKILKCFWPLLLGMLVCIGFQIMVKPTRPRLDSDVITDMIAQLAAGGKRQIDYFYYILKLRCSQIAFLLICRFIKKEKAGNFLWLWMMGMGIGVGAYYFIAAYRILGLLLLLGFLFPHFFLYLLAYYKYMNIDQKGQCRDAGGKKKRGKILSVIQIFLVVIIGLLSEFYVNPYLVNFLGKIIYIKNYKI